jgi:hypothetical protein
MSAGLTMPDETLEWLGDRFTASSLRDGMTFEQFLALPQATREHRLALQSDIDAVERQAAQALPPRSTSHNRTVIEPVKPPVRLRRNPWFFRRR